MISEQQADNVLILKYKQCHLLEDVQGLFADLEKSQYRAYNVDYHKTVNRNHGNIEICNCYSIYDPQVLCHLRDLDNPKNFIIVSRIRAQNRLDEESSCEESIHFASISIAKQVPLTVRSRGIENGFHWMLGIACDKAPVIFTWTMTLRILLSSAKKD